MVYREVYTHHGTGGGIQGGIYPPWYQERLYPGIHPCYTPRRLYPGIHPWYTPVTPWVHHGGYVRLTPGLYLGEEERMMRRVLPFLPKIRRE